MGIIFQIEIRKMKLFVVLCFIGAALAIPNPFTPEKATGLVYPGEYYGKGYSPSYYGKGYSKGYSPSYYGKGYSRGYVPYCPPTYHPRRVIRRRTCCYRRRYNKGCYTPALDHCYVVQRDST